MVKNNNDGILACRQPHDDISDPESVGGKFLTEFYAFGFRHFSNILIVRDYKSFERDFLPDIALGNFVLNCVDDRFEKKIRFSFRIDVKSTVHFIHISYDDIDKNVHLGLSRDSQDVTKVLLKLIGRYI